MTIGRAGFAGLSILLAAACGARNQAPSPPPPAAVTVTVAVDAGQLHQVIDGFGGTEFWRFPPPSEFSRIFDELGVSLLRFRLLNYVEAVPDEPGNEARDNDNNDPFTIDWANVKIQYFDPLAPLLEAAKSRGARLLGVVMSPPQWMKTNNLESGQGALKPGYEDEYVEFIMIWIQGLERYHGIHIDYVDFENEPNFARDYDGCLIPADQIVTLTKKLGARLAAATIDTKIVPPETNTLDAFPGYANVICGDADAKRNVTALATHSYGIDFFNPDQNNSKWTAAGGLARGCGKPLWLTEYSLDYDESQKGTWNEAINLVQHVHDALVNGGVSAWLYHEIYEDPSKTPLALIDPGPNGSVVHPKFYVLKQYFHYVRPGDVRIGAQSSDADILVTAFLQRPSSTVSVVAINRKSSAESVRFMLSSLAGNQSLAVTRTSRSENTVDLGPVSVINGAYIYTLPANSVTTFSRN